VKGNRLLIRLLLIFLALFFFSAARFPVRAETAMTAFSYQDCSRFLKANSFASKEELMQLFYYIYKADTLDNIVLDRETILRLKKDINTYFPLNRCKTIRYSHHELTLVFDSDVMVPIPGMWRQIKLYMPKEVAFSVSRFPDDSLAIRFKLKK
jgi:hypothetical protein